MTKFSELSSAARLRVMLSDRIDHEVKKAFLTQLSPLEKEAFGGLARGLLSGGASLAARVARGGGVAGALRGQRAALGSGLLKNLPSTVNKGMHHAMTCPLNIFDIFHISSHKGNHGWTETALRDHC